MSLHAGLYTRQHQYFEQRKRLLNSWGLEQDAGDSMNTSQNLQHARSLDVSSLMSICLAIHGTSQPEFSSIEGLGNNKKGVLQQRKTGLTNEKNKNHIPSTFNVLKTQYHLAQDVPLKEDAGTQWTPSSAEEAAKAFKHTECLRLFNSHDGQRGEKENDLKDHGSKANCPPKKFSLLDIISDSSDGISRKRSPLELHASFAIEGTGKMRNQTPNSFSLVEERSPILTRNSPAAPMPKRVEQLASPPILRYNSFDFERIWGGHHQDNLRKGFNFSTMPTNASLLTDETMFGWEDEDQQMDMCPDKFIFCELPPTIPSIEDNLYSLNMRRVNKSSNISCHDGTYEMDHSFPDCFSSPIDTSVILDNHLRTSHVVNTRNFIEDVAKLFNEDDLDWSPISPYKELETKGKGYRSTREEIHIKSMNLPAEHVLIENAPYHRLYKKARIMHNSDCNAPNLDLSTSSTSDLHPMMHVGSKNGGNGWDDAFSDESCSSSIQNIAWPQDPLERNCQAVENVPSTAAKFLSCKTKNDGGINTTNLEVPEIYICRTISPESPNFHQQRLGKMGVAVNLDELEICNSKALSGDSQTSPYLEELYPMQEKPDLMACKSSIIGSTSQTNTQAIDSLTAQLFKSDKRIPVFRRSFDATFEPKFSTPFESPPNSKLSVSGDLESEDESVSSPLSYLEGKEGIKYLTIPQKFTLQNDSIHKQDSKVKLNRFHSNTKVDQVSRSMDQLKVVIHEHLDAQRSRTQRDKQSSVNPPKHQTSLKIESSLIPTNNQEDIQFTESQNNRHDVHHIETQAKECSSSSYAERQDHPISDENKEAVTSPGKLLSIKPEGKSDNEAGYFTRNHLRRPSLIDLSGVNREKFGIEENKGKADNRSDSEYQGMLESYILQLRSMYRALQETLDQEHIQ